MHVYSLIFLYISGVWPCCTTTRRYHDDKMINYDTQDGYAVYAVKGPSTHMHQMGASSAIGASPPVLDQPTFGIVSNIRSATTTIDGNQRDAVQANFTSLDKNGSSTSSSSTPSATKPGAVVEQPSSPAMSSSMAQSSSNFAKVLSTSVLSIQEVNFKHAGNYTCAPSNARPVSITVHVLRGMSNNAVREYILYMFCVARYIRV